MVIAVLALLGVNLAATLIFVGFVVGRKRWVKRQPGASREPFASPTVKSRALRPSGAVATATGSEVLVWTKGPFLYRNELLPADGIEQRPAAVDEVKRLGDNPTVTR